MIRLAKKEDLMQVAQVHIECFPNSFSSCLGVKLLSKFYFEYLCQNPTLFLVLDDTGIQGFCVGYLCDDINLTKRFIKKNFFHFLIRCFFLGISLNRVFWRKIKTFLSKKKQKNEIVLAKQFDVYCEVDKGDLLSICLKQSYRGKGFATKLMISFLNTLSSIPRQCCVLSVDSTNDRGIRFYEKNGFVLYKQRTDCLIYAKNLLDEYE